MSDTRTVKTYTKKPVEISAVQWDGTAAHAAEIIRWIEDEWLNVTRVDPDWRITYDHGRTSYGRMDSKIEIHTLEGVMEASPGDWIIRGVEGEFYPCKPGIFDKTYQLATA